MKVRVIALFAALLLTIVSTSAQARVHHRHTAQHRAHHAHIAALTTGVCEYNNDGRVKCGGTTQRVVRPRGRTEYAISTSEWRQHTSEGIVGHPNGCPRSAFCGCGASVRLFGHPVRDLYLASNWFRFPRAAPAPGMVAVRNHHVFVIEAVNGDGTVVAYDANSGGHQTRVHTVSLSGYSVRDPHGFHMASR